MDNKEQYLDSITEIRSIMERSSKFLSLSGLSGIAAGIVAIVSGFIAYHFYDTKVAIEERDTMVFNYFLPLDKLFFYIGLGSITLLVAILLAFYFTRRKAKAKKLPMWDKTAKLLMLDMLVPLVVGGLFVLIQIFYFRIVTLAAATMLIFYGVALFSASKYTVKATRWLAVSEIILGFFALIFFGYGLLYWMIGFGVLHIIYGSVLYYKYDK